MSEKTERTARRNRKELAAKILAAQGETYDAWLDARHQDVIDAGTATVDAALRLMIDQQETSGEGTRGCKPI